MPTNSTENIYSTEFENDPTPIPSSKIGYDNTESGLEATTVQGAIDELDEKIKASDEASEITYDSTESGIEAENVQDAIDEVVQAMGNYQFIGKISVPITIAGTALNFTQQYPTALKEYADTLDDDVYLMPYAMALSTKQGDATVTNFGTNTVRQDHVYKLLHSGMTDSLNIDADSFVLFGGDTKVRWRKIVCHPTAGHLLWVEVDSTTNPTTITFVPHDNDVCDSVTSTLYCLEFKKVK